MLFDKEGSPWITIGPDFLFTLCMFVFLGGMYSVFLFFLYHIKTSYNIFWYLGWMLVMVNLFSTLFTVLYNPGHPKKIKGLPRNREWWNIWNAPKLSCFETYHCEDWDKCVEWYDHHCPWFGKWIGRNTLITFYVFIGSFLAMIFAVFMTIAVYLEQNKIPRKRRDKKKLL
jgi:hypothetical protein